MEKFYKAIKEGLSETDQVTLFSTGANDNLQQACAALLKECGWSVKEPRPSTVAAVKTLDDLISYFYQRMGKEQPKAMIYENLPRDRKIAKLFIENRMQSSGLNRATALQECATIIKTLLDNYDKFHFKYDVSFAVFGNDKASWITQKAIDIMNAEGKVKRKESHRQQIEKVTAAAAKDTPMGYDDLDALLEQIEEENNGSS